MLVFPLISFAYETDVKNSRFIAEVLSSVEETLDTVICNPPFHDGHKQLTSIAESMFHESFHQLRSGGELLVVANRHLPYTKVLKRLFRNVELISDDKRFNIYRCVR